MPREIFGEIVDPTARVGSRSRLAVPLSLAAHVALAAAVVIVPLVAVDGTPNLRGDTVAVFNVPPPLPQPPPPAPARTVAASAVTPARRMAPSVAPDKIPPATGAETTSTAAVGPEGDSPGGVPGGEFGSPAPLPIVPLPPPPPVVTQPLPVGGKIKPPVKVRHVPPVYPAFAQEARVEGIVIIEAVVGVDGRVKQARVLRSKPLLDEAALTAVRQWEFSPTMLNGVPVPIIMTVTVNFTLR